MYLLAVFILYCGATVAEDSDGFFLCLESGRPIPTDYICDGYADCLDGTDEFDCGSGFRCETYEFQCTTIEMCVNMVFKCDGHNHCPDGSDEKECSTSLRDCKEWEYTCGNGRCIPSLYQCDGYDDCGDKSDETSCATETCNPETEWMCKSDGTCIAKNWRCDYEKDCNDGSDEKGCSIFNHRCGAGLFNCSHTECISSNKLCDGYQDCLTNVGADEDSSICLTLDCGRNEFACPEKCLTNLDSVCDGNYDCMDGSDEIGCALSCSYNQFQCVQGACVDLTKRCDLVEDCLDGSDEFMCAPSILLECPINQYLCEDGLLCIPHEYLCDGTDQCGDGSDESVCSFISIDGCTDNNGGCEHNCSTNGHLSYCSCNSGFTINNGICSDIDECNLLHGLCDQQCTNTIGSYTCSCADGYILSDEHNRCKAKGPAISLVVTNWFDIQQLNLRSGQLNISMSDMSSATAVDYHYRYGLIFWSDLNDGLILAGKFDGSERRTVADIGIKRPEGLAVDWINDHIYWTDSELNRVEVANIDGSKRAVLFTGLQHPRDIVIDPIKRVLFWTEEHAIVKASLDGMKKEEFLSGLWNFILWPSGLTLDLPSQTLYWIDTGTRSIGSCRTDGKHQRLLYSGNLTHPFGITVFEDRLYWTDRNIGSVFSISKNGKGFRQVLSDIYKPMDIIGVHPLRQPEPSTSVSEHCFVDNGGCDYLCLPGTDTHSCHCPAFRNVLPDQQSCSRMDIFMLFSMTDRIHAFTLEYSSRYDVELPLGIDELSNIVVIDWLGVDDVIFWGDASQKTINSAAINGSFQKVLVGVDVQYPTGLAVDWVANKLYWTDSELGRIYVSELDGSSRTVIVSTEDGILSDVVVHPLSGLLYYGVQFHNKKSQIRQAHLDGSKDRKMTSCEGSIPSLFTIDYSGERLYWIDNSNAKLQSIFLNGSDYEELLESGILYKSKGLSEYGGYLYWTDEVDGSIHAIEKSPPYQTEELISNRQGLKDVTVFHRNRQNPNFHPCWIDNGGCSHLCIGVPLDDEYGDLIASCRCSTGYLLLDDGKTCDTNIDQFLIFGTDHRIGFVSLDIHSNVDVTIPVHPKSNNKILSLDFDLKSDYIFWIEEDIPTIYRINMKGGNKESVISVGLIKPTALAVDWLGGNLYFGDSGTRRLEVCRLDGSNRKVLVSDNNVGEILDIVLDFNSQYIFWSSSIPSPQVFRALMDGSNPMAIIHSSYITQPAYLAVDNRGASSKLYVADNTEQRINIFDADGEVEALFTITNSRIGGLAVDEQYVYWIDTDNGILHKLQKEGGESERINVNLEDVSYLKLVRRTYQLTNSALTLHYACTEDLHVCSHLCLPNWDLSRYKCACPTGIQDQEKCPAVPSLFLIFSTSNSIRRLSLESAEYHDVVIIPDLDKVSFLDYHLTEGQIYWSDTTRFAIMQSDMNGNSVKPLINFKHNPRGLSVDWTTGNVYYIDAGVPSIEVVDSTGRFNKVLINSSLDEPVDLAVLPSQGFMFWTDFSKKPSKIMRARMDGSQIEALVNLGKQKPTQLTVTPDNGYLYWVDASNGTLQRIKYDGTGHQLVWKNIGRPFGVAVYDQSIFWTDVFEGIVYRCNSRNNLEQKRAQYVERSSGSPKGIAVVSKTRNGEVNGNYSASACGYRNGDCKYLCIPITEFERKCACPTSESSCTEYGGIHSWTLPITPSSVVPLSTSITDQYNSSAMVSPNTPINHQSTTSTRLGEILDNVSVAVLVLIGVFLLAIVGVLSCILVLFWKYKSLNASDKISAPHPQKQLLVNNPLYDKVTVASTKDITTTTPDEVVVNENFKPSYQLNNTIELQTLNKEKGNVKLRSVAAAASKPKPKLMNNALDTFEPPEEYRITPVQPRHSYHSPPTTDVPITFHYPDSSPTHKPAPNVPQSNMSALSPSNATRHVHFKSSVLDPPPVPPRSVCFQSLSSYASTKVSETSSIVPPLSAPATSHTPTFFPDSAKNQICSRNPMFGRSSSSSVDDINLLVESNIGLFSPFKSESGLFNEQ